MFKVCTKCHKRLHISNFYKRKSGKYGVRNECKECWKKQITKYNKENKEKFKKWLKKSETKRKLSGKDKMSYKKYNSSEKGKAREKVRLCGKYGITVDDYNTLFEEQNGCCGICGKHQSELPESLGIDHSHDTGEVRGLLCRFCNLLIGNAFENKNTLRKAIKYLVKYKEQE